eukprot:1968797-Prymnesium_polylepis.2
MRPDSSTTALWMRRTQYCLPKRWDGRSSSTAAHWLVDGSQRVDQMGDSWSFLTRLARTSQIGACGHLAGGSGCHWSRGHTSRASSMTTRRDSSRRGHAWPCTLAYSKPGNLCCDPPIFSIQ